jgi:hypothetical protein
MWSTCLDFFSRRHRAEQTQRDKIEARLMAARDQQSRTSSNLIHVQSRFDASHNTKSELNDEQQQTTKKSLKILTDQDRSTASVDAHGNRKGTIAHVEI